MSELLAGAIGAAIALAGAFGVQMFAGRQARRARTVELASRFLATQQRLVFLVDMVRGAPNGQVRVDRSLLALDAQTESIAIGYELKRIGGRKVSRQINASLAAAMDVLAASSPDTSDHRWSVMRQAHMEFTFELDDFIQTAL